MLRPTRFCFILALLVLGGAAAFAQRRTEMYNGREVSSNEIIVRRGTNNLAAFSAVTSALLPAESIEVLSQRLGLYVVRSPNRRVAALIAAFASRGDLVYAEPNYRVHTDAVPNDQYFSSLYGMQKIGTPSAWDTSTGSRSTVLGIVDTGVYYSHPDLAANIWSAPASFTVTVNGTQVTCLAGSHGFNAITGTCDPLDDNGHGTHVAGTIGAAGNNGIGVVGVNWTASIMALKFLDSTGNGYVSDAVKAIDFAIQVKSYFSTTATPVNIRVLSNSWGGTGFSQALLDEINSAGNSNMLFVAAAGNSTGNDDVTKTYPASYGATNELTVAATDSNDALASFSNYGPTSVDLAAPGVNILSTYPTNTYAYLSGTSMATPHVSGSALLLLSACPSLTTTSLLKNAIVSNVDTVSGLSGVVKSGGRLNIYRAIQSCAGPLLPSISSITVSPNPIQSGQQGTVTVNLTSPAGNGGVAVSLTSSYPAGVSLPSAVTIPQNSTSTSVTFTAGVVSAATQFTVTATYLGVGQSSTDTLNPVPPPPSASVSFVTLDTATQGNWKAKYGADGFSIMGDATQNPSYVTPTTDGAQWTWTPTTSDVRALQKSSGSDRVAATWYGTPTFTFDLNFTDQSTHQVAIYCMDWDNASRVQRIDLLDTNNNVLDTHSLAAFSGGQYLVWNITGHVKIRTTALAANSVVEGIFFGGAGTTITPPPTNPPPSSATVSFVTLDTTTQGNWKSQYGADGYSLVGDVTLNPSYVTPSSDGAQYIWSSSTSDVRALQKVSGSDRIAATWYGSPTFTIDLNFTDQSTHQVAMYCMDWDANSRVQEIDVLDTNNTVLDTRTLSNFSAGKYVVWNISGHVKIRITAQTFNSVVEGIFFGVAGSVTPPPPPPPPPSSGGTATFLTLDTTTQGTWKGVYGTEGYAVAGDSVQNPSYVTPTTDGIQYVWTPSTSDVRALQKGTGSDRIAGTWYGSPTFTFDLSFTDQNTHQVTIYCMDYDANGPRMERIDILDVNDNVLDTRTISNFVLGEYLVWSMSGHVKIRVTALNTNSVVEGIFFK